MALTDSLISYWPLNEASGDALDAHGSNDLTDNNTVGSTTGKLGNARLFTAANSEYFSLADNPSLSMGDVDFEFSCWVKLTSTGISQTVLAKDAGGSDREYILNIQATNLVTVFYWDTGGGLTSFNASTFGALSAGTWYFLSFYHDSVANELGVGVNLTFDTVSETLGVRDAAAAFTLGRNSAVNYANMAIDDVGFWKGRVLSGTERTQLYNGGAGLAYPFAAASGNPHYYYQQQQLVI